MSIHFWTLSINVITKVYGLGTFFELLSRMWETLFFTGWNTYITFCHLVVTPVHTLSSAELTTFYALRSATDILFDAWVSTWWLGGDLLGQPSNIVGFSPHKQYGFWSARSNADIWTTITHRRSESLDDKHLLRTIPLDIFKGIW